MIKKIGNFFSTWFDSWIDSREAQVRDMIRNRYYL